MGVYIFCQRFANTCYPVRGVFRAVSLFSFSVAGELDNSHPFPLISTHAKTKKHELINYRGSDISPSVISIVCVPT